MGISGLTSFIKQRELINDHELHDCTIIVDGMNLLNTIFFKFQSNKMDSIFGGDYNRLMIHICQFFHHLKACNITALVIIDGSIDPSFDKFQTLRTRSSKQLNSAYRIYKTNHSDEQILPFYAFEVFELLLKQLKIYVKRCIYEADPIIVELAKKLNCLVATNDSDFFLENITSGIVLLDSLVENCHVLTKLDKTKKYLKCSIYNIQNLKNIFHFVNMDVIPCAGFILGNDYIDYSISAKFMSRLPTISKHSNKRQRHIYNVLHWISHFKTIDSLLETLTLEFNDKNNVLVDKIQQIALNQNEMEGYFSFDPFVETFFNNLPQAKTLSIPDEMIIRHINCDMNARILSIANVHIDWCRPLIEDFSIANSSYESSFQLCNRIYALLRQMDTNIPNTKRYHRKGNNFCIEIIQPKIMIDDRLLPKLNELIHLSPENKVILYYHLIELPDNLLKEINNLFIEFVYTETFQLNEEQLSLTILMLVSLIYMLRKFPHEIWIEFVYAICLNILLVGNTCQDETARLFILDKSQRSIINEHFNSFNEMPTFIHSQVYVPRIVHLYNTFQACHYYQTMLIDILSLHSILNLTRQPFSLNGTFIYNLTIDLARRTKPYLYVDELLGRDSFQGKPLFKNIIAFVLKHSGRHFYTNQICDDNMIPSSFKKSTSTLFPDINNQSLSHCFVRAFEMTTRKTHIQSQKLKLRK